MAIKSNYTKMDCPKLIIKYFQKSIDPLCAWKVTELNPYSQAQIVESSFEFLTNGWVHTQFMCLRHVHCASFLVWDSLDVFNSLMFMWDALPLNASLNGYIGLKTILTGACLWQVLVLFLSTRWHMTFLS